MNLSETEIKILKFLSENSLMTKIEIMARMGNNNGTVSLLKTLCECGYITSITPIGETAYAITQKGERILKNLEK